MENRLRPRDAIGTWALLAATTLLAYAPALHGGLLWDDDQHVTGPAFQSLHGLARIWFDPGATQQYYPLVHTAFWIEHRLWGDAVLGYHLLNVLLHATAAFLAIVILRRLALPGAYLAGFLFALHPVAVEAVAWISEQKSTLSAVLYLGAALAYLHFDRTRRRAPYLLAAALFVLALLAKTVTATLPAALLVVIWWQRGRLDWRRDVLPPLPWLALGGIAGAVTASLERTSIGAQGADFALTMPQRFVLAGRALWFYAEKVVWPANLTFSYSRWTLDGRYLYPAAAMAVAAALALLARRRRGPLAAFLYFTGTLFPALGFLNVYPFLFSFVADHFQYLAMLGILAPLACGLTLIAHRLAVPLRICAAAALLAVPGMLTWRQCGMYRDSETLYRATLARNPASWLAHTNLCAILQSQPAGLAEAIAECQAALRLRPRYAEAHNDLGTALAQMPDRLPEAMDEFRAAIDGKPQFPEAHFNLANALARVPDRQPDAIAEYRAALRIRPDYREAHLNLGAVLLRTPGRVEEAIAEDRAALALQPDSAEAHNNLGSALAQLPGHLPEAIAEFRSALAIDPRYARAHNNLGSLLAEDPGRLSDAIAEYQAALAANPAYTEAHYNLGVALARAGRAPEAIAEFAAVLAFDPNSASAQYNLGVLLLRAGRGSEALPHLESALRLRPSPDLERTVARLRSAQK